MRYLMGKGRVVGLGVFEGLEGRHLHIVGFERVVGTVTAVPDISARGGEEGLGGFVAFDPLGHLLGGRVVVLGQTVDLFDVEHRVALHERDRDLALLAVVVGLGLAELVGIDHGLTFGAPADLAPELLRLPVGHPDRGRVAAGDTGRPEQDDVQTAIADAVVAEWPCDAAGEMFGVPGLVPGANPGLEIGDDLVRHAGVDVEFLCHVVLRCLGPVRDAEEEAGARQATGHGQHGSGKARRREGAGRPLRGRRRLPRSADHSLARVHATVTAMTKRDQPMM